MNEGRHASLEAFLAKAGRRLLVMGIVNVTPDSFSDGGRFEGPAAAVAAGLAMAEDGAALIDVGGESTRPGFAPVSAEEELDRVIPVLEGLLCRLAVPVSIDTTKPAVARRALSLGAALVNDIWGFQGDPSVASVVAEAGAGAILMHNRETKDPALDIVDDIRRFFDRSLGIAERAGVRRENLILDPGIGFGKTPSQQWAAIAGLSRLGDYGLPVLVGVSRKSFLGLLSGATVGDRDIETVAANLAAAASGATLFRVHDVRAHVRALKVFEAVRGACA